MTRPRLPPWDRFLPLPKSERPPLIFYVLFLDTHFETSDDTARDVDFSSSQSFFLLASDHLFSPFPNLTPHTSSFLLSLDRAISTSSCLRGYTYVLFACPDVSVPSFPEQLVQTA